MFSLSNEPLPDMLLIAGLTKEFREEIYESHISFHMTLLYNF